MSKRTIKPDFYKQQKKLRVSTLTVENAGSSSAQPERINYSSVLDLPTDTEAALIYLKNKFPTENFLGKLPPVILVHQLYSIINSKTKVDLDINVLQRKGLIRLFKLGGEEAAQVIIYTDDLIQHVSKCSPEIPIIQRYLKNIISKVNDVGVDKEVLTKEFHLTEQHISDLVSAGLLTLRTASSFWFSFPNAGEFMKTYLKGRKSILRTIRKSKFSEILQTELQQRKLEKSAKLGMAYHIHDVIGAELVKCVPTTSGNLLRIYKSNESRKSGVVRQS